MHRVRALVRLHLRYTQHNCMDMCASAYVIFIIAVPRTNRKTATPKSHHRRDTRSARHSTGPGNKNNTHTHSRTHHTRTPAERDQYMFNSITHTHTHITPALCYSYFIYVLHVRSVRLCTLRNMRRHAYVIRFSRLSYLYLASFVCVCAHTDRRTDSRTHASTCNMIPQS